MPRWHAGGSLLVALLTVGAPLRAQIDCFECHDTDAEVFAETVHGFLECAHCHEGTDELPHPDDLARPDCSTCHDTIVEEYTASLHGQTRKNGAAEAPDCTACHGPVHELVPRSDPSSPVHPVRLAQTCGACHADPDMVKKFGIPIALPLEAYQASVHARKVAEGVHAATCNDCHGSHGIFSASDFRSSVFHLSVPDTCGTCHGEIAETYGDSVHGRAAKHGVREAPVCTDCHGEHRIQSPAEAGSPVYASNVPKMTCGRCHGDLRLAEKFGMSADMVPAYEDSYHGLASRAGTTLVAHCGSCHGVHDILPSSDPASHVHKGNLAETCGRCHPGAGTRFAIGTVHVLPTEPEHATIYWVRVFYLSLIYMTVGGMLMHNLLDLRRKVKDRARFLAFPEAQGGTRMSSPFRIAHGMLMVSFIVLAYTGFALKYPEAWWARPLLYWESSFAFRGWLHRGAALLMVAGLLFHLFHLLRDRTARACIAKMRPTLADVVEFREKMLYYLGRRESPPHVPDLGYPEKMEYIALMWGIVVMAATGFLLWFEGPALRWLPKWVSDTATVIHFYEAVLASLAIVVWHLYFVIFDPVVYPMDTAWLTGRSAPGRVAERHAGSPASAVASASSGREPVRARRHRSA